jgi:formate hydrogenlyase subunit 4
MNPFAPALSLLLSPLLLSVINRSKALLAGRRGAPLLQPYFDLARLLKKGVIYSEVSAGLVQLAPVCNLAALFCCTLLVPMGPLPALVSFQGDFVLLAYLMGLGRFVTMLGALDTGSSFEGMGASREAFFSALAEPAFFLAMAGLSRMTGSLTLAGMLQGITAEHWLHGAPSLLLILVALFLVFLAENARIPVDDPTTHLELTMVHEVMILDHSGPDLAMLEYGVALKLWLMAAVSAALLVPAGTSALWLPLFFVLMFIIGVLVALVESSMARLRLIRVPQLLIGAGVFAGLALFLEFVQ